MKKNWHFLVLLAIIIIAIFVRTYNYHNWLYFEADQVRNANNSIDVIENGIDSLPLLGPKAGGTDFHLGPISYYFEYLSGLVFGVEHPAVFAFSNFIFLLLAIPLFYYFLSHFFSKGQNLLVTSLFSSSYLATQYSRFSWNPNGIIFWGLLFILAVYKIKTENKPRRRGWWFLILVLSYGISSQLHTLALLGYPLVFLFFFLACFLLKIFSQEKRKEWLGSKELFNRVINIFKIWKKNCVLTKINWKYWAGAILIILVLYSPLIIYDIKNQGANSREFVKAFIVKGEKRSTIEKVEKTLDLYGDNYMLTLSSLNNKEVASKIIGFLFLIISLIVVVLSFFKNKNNEAFKTFLVLILVWFFIFLLIHYKLAFDIDQPRFWFPCFFIPYIFLASIISHGWNKKMGKILAVIFCGAMIFFNLTAILNWYKQVGQQNENGFLGRKITSSTLIQNDFIGYEDLEEVVDWIKNESEKETGKACFNSPSTYLASYKYIFNRKYPDFEARRINSTVEMNLVDDCNVFIIDHSGNSKGQIVDKFSKKDIKIGLEKGVTFNLISIWSVEKQ